MGKATLSKKVALVQNADGGLLPGTRHNAEPYRASVDIKHSIGWIALGKDGLLSVEGLNLFAVPWVRKECYAIELDAPVVRGPAGHRGSRAELRTACRPPCAHQAGREALFGLRVKCSRLPWVSPRDVYATRLAWTT